MSSENAAPIEEEIRALEMQLAQKREQRLLQRKEALLAELARHEAAESDREADLADAEPPTKMPEIRVSERSLAAEPPKLDGSGQRVLGALKRTIESVSGRNEKASAAPADSGHTSALYADAIASIERKLDAIAEQVSSAPHEAHAVTQEALQQVMNEIVTAIGRQSHAAEQQARAIRTDLQAIHTQGAQLAETIAELGVETEEELATPQVLAPGGLEAAVCGQSLASDPSLAPARHELVSGFLASDRGALGLVGELLLFHAAPPDRMPQLLKDVGEAYYRWRPQAAHAADPFQYAMIEWLTAECEQVGSANRIELVRPGDRYDAARHHAKSRGLEVTDVHGWVVLRDNGKVYTKASVAVR